MTYTVYSKPNCPQCDRAKALIKSKGLTYNEIIFDVGQPKVDGVQYIAVADFKAKYPDAASAPQIFVGEERIGGLPDLMKVL